MRKFKFRARWKDTGLMLPNLMVNYSIEVLNRNSLFVEEFTGLKDKNGTEIYEGDIIKGNKGIYFIQWNDYFACFNAIDRDKKYFELRKSLMLKTEVIGNVFENPELLKKRGV